MLNASGHRVEGMIGPVVVVDEGETPTGVRLTRGVPESADDIIFSPWNFATVSWALLVNLPEAVIAIVHLETKRSPE